MKTNQKTTRIKIYQFNPHKKKWERLPLGNIIFGDEIIIGGEVRIAVNSDVIYSSEEDENDPSET